MTWSTSPAYRAAVATSHVADTVVEVLSAGRVLATLPVLAGTVNIDRTAAIRRNLTFQMSDPDGSYTPKVTTDLLHPYSGHELRVWRGVRTGTSRTDTLQPIAGQPGFEYVPCGVFNIDSCTASDTEDDVQLTVAGFDRSVRVQLNRWSSTYVVAAGNGVTRLAALIHDRYPDAVLNFPTPEELPFTVPAAAYDPSSSNDPWKAAQDMATNLGCELFFDQLGACTLREVPDPGTAPVAARFEEGANATLVKLDKALSRAGVYNHVVVTGEPATGTGPFRAEASDDNPDSPTWVGGDFGDVVYFYSTPLATSGDQCAAIARGWLRKTLGLRESLTVEALTDASLDATDVVSVKRARLGVDDTYLIETLAIQLDPTGTMSGTTRQRTVTP